ncbi:serine pats1 threonine-protein kinase, partial [Mytilus galloprovincialis]
LTFCKRSKEGFPKIIFVATHKDMVSLISKFSFKSYRRKLEDKIQKIFESHAGLKHLEFKPLLFINSTNPKDPEIKELQQRLMKRATEHPRWGEEMPTAWIPLDLQLTMKVEEGTNIISLEQIKSLNSKKKSMALSEKQIVTFLEVQHSLGKLLYFNVENLRDYVIISPAYLVEVLRSIVTEKQFWCKSGRFPRILKIIQETGFIDREDIYHLWTQKEFMHILKYKEYMVDLLVHLDVIIAPRTSFELSSRPLRDVSRFLVPCMITRTNDTKYLEKFRNYNNSIVMAYKFIEEIIPPALSYRFLGSLVTMWHVKQYAFTENKRENTLLFSDLYVVEVGNSHEIAVQVKGNRVVVSLVHTVNKKNIIPTLASSIQECLTTAMLGICQFYSTLSDAQNSSSKHQAMPFEIELGVFCKSDICFFHHNEIRPNSPWFCSQHRKKNEVGYLQAWFSEKLQPLCKLNTYEQLNLSEKLDIDKHDHLQALMMKFNAPEPSDKCLSTCIGNSIDKTGFTSLFMRALAVIRGLGRMALERCPSDKHLRRLVAEFSPGKCRELAIELGLSVNEWENFEYQFQFQIPDDLKLVAIRSCREKSRNFTFHMIVRVLEKLELSHHLLCKVIKNNNTTKQMYTKDELQVLTNWEVISARTKRPPAVVLRDVKPDVSGIPEDTLNNPPSNKLLLDLSNHIGNSSMQLAIELDLDSTTIQQIQYKNKTKLLEQTKEILQIWSYSSSRI